ncbi:MAG: hypothetical protein J6C15_03225 [Bacteroidaceae bacterium]|nr:hypothetical protein [Bacteroidaceae bacterium]
MMCKQKIIDRYFRLLCLCGWLLWSLAFVACQDDEVLPEPPEENKRTVLIYVAAENSLGAGENWRRDSLEIQEGAQALKPGQHLLAFVDDGRVPRLYLFQKGQEPKLEQMWPEGLCSTDPATLCRVLQTVVTAYPADDYGLVMWSHADGWLPPTNTDYSLLSFGIDVGQGGDLWKDKDKNGRIGAQMSIGNMAEAIAESGVKLCYVFFDACLMQNLEVAYALRHVTDYIIASPISIPARGAYYTHQVAEGLFSNNPADIARIYYEDIISPDLYNHYTDFGIVVSAIETRWLEELAAVTADVLPVSQLAGGASPDMRGVQIYKTYSATYYYRPHNYDAASAMRHLLAEADFLRFRSVLDKVVCYKGATPSFWIGPLGWSFCEVEADCAGVSMFIPQRVYTENAEQCIYGDLNEAFKETEWYQAAGWKNIGW